MRHQRRVEDFPPNSEGYERMAAVWNDFAGWFVPPYGRFLTSAGAYYGQPIQSVLDLACGTGLLTRALARRAESVVGLDASEAMLSDARARTKASNVRYIRADFRVFSLEETFNAVVCGSDSLNYIQASEELAEVFRCVYRHLRPGGLLVFDVLDHAALLAMASVKVIAMLGREWFQIYFFYDPHTRVNESRAVLEGAIERHRRIPIEEEDVRRAAAEVGLDVVEHFTTAPWLRLLSRSSFVRHFYILRRL
jgi:SAM-dependent methyltransferase